MVGSLDKSHQETMEKFSSLTTEMEKTRSAIIDLKEVIVKLDNQNRKLQRWGLIISIVGASNIIVIIANLITNLFLP